MFWPPNWVANNTVELSDGRYVVDHPGDERFATFQQQATILSPWLSWDDIDSRWPANDAMMRVLLIGEPNDVLYSVNADSVGSIITLGTVGAGLQRWEVVSYFDYYVSDEVAKSGCYAWCRLWDGVSGAGDDGGGDDGGAGGGVYQGIVGTTGDDGDTTLTTTLAATLTGRAFVFIGVVTEDAVVTGCTFDGVPMSLVGAEEFNTAGDMYLILFNSAVTSGDAGVFSISFDRTTKAMCSVLYVDQEPGGIDAETFRGDATEVAFTWSGLISDLNHWVLACAIGKDPTSPMGWNIPTINNTTFNHVTVDGGSEQAYMMGGLQFYPAASLPDWLMTTSSTNDWLVYGISLHS